jgi:hypothetical protein
LASGTSGGVLAYTAAGTLASSAALAANALVIGGGAGAAPSTTTTGTGVVTALGVNTGTAGAFVVNGGALGTPASGTVTNLTGTASININGTVGATTATTGAFTTVTATGSVTATGTDTGDIFRGLNSSASNRNDFVVRNAASNMVLGAVVGTTGILAGNSVIATVSSTGLAVTGALSATTTLGVTGVSTLTAGAVIQGLTVGRGAGAVATNTVVGNGALATNSTGTELTAVGVNALNLNTGSSNTALGDRSMQANLTGAQNTASGSFSLAANTLGSQNVANGRVALSNNLTGGNNTALGHSALRLNTAGSNNTAVGYQSLDGNLASSNIAIGYNSGYGITTGASNVILGSYTGSTAPISATGSNFVVLSDGNGNVRQFFNGATATFNGAVGVTGTITSLAANGLVVADGNSGSRTRMGSTGGGFNFIETEGSADLNIRRNSVIVAVVTATGVDVTGTLKASTGAAVGNATPGAGGLAFPATAVAVADANTLDDYEEGTWTPADGSGAGLVFTGVTGNYTKIGRMVTAICSFTYPSTADVTLSLVSGLQFPIAAGSSMVNISIGFKNGAAASAAFMFGLNGTATFRPVNSAGAAITNAAVSLARFDLQLTYFV